MYSKLSNRLHKVGDVNNLILSRVFCSLDAVCVCVILMMCNMCSVFHVFTAHFTTRCNGFYQSGWFVAGFILLYSR